MYREDRDYWPKPSATTSKFQKEQRKLHSNFMSLCLLLIIIVVLEMFTGEVSFALLGAGLPAAIFVAYIIHQRYISRRITQ